MESSMGKMKLVWPKVILLQQRFSAGKLASSKDEYNENM
jgi:hypothetical protein